MKSLKLAYIAALVIGIVILLAIIVVLVAPLSPLQQAQPRAPTVEITLIGGEFDDKYGFAFEGQALSSPGPTLKVKVGETVKINFINKGQIPHTFAIVQELKFDATPLFGASIGSPSKPIFPDVESSIIFTANRAGSFSYICTVPGHLERGMLGKIIIEE
ncbi:MAG: cupredoxin domain-containing protein [Nitrososphaerales archaeon]